MRNWIEYWMVVHSILLLVFTFLFAWTLQLGYLTAIAILSFLSFIVINGIQNKSFSFLLEGANLVSILRLTALLFILICHSYLNHWIIALLCSSFLLADGLDGYLARKYNTASIFGAYLDMETDAFYVLSLGSLIYYYQLLGPWILGIGLLRYTYFLVISFFKAPEKKEDRAFRAQFIAVVLMISLMLCFITPATIYVPLVIIASLLVCYSFGASFWFVLREGRKRRG